MKGFPRRLIILGLIVLGLAVIFASRGQATTLPEEHSPNWGQIDELTTTPAEIIRGENPSTLPPPEQNPCQHCHIEGEIVWEWSPISRWLVFGAMNLTFVFGIAINATVWKTREIWHHPAMVRFGKIAAIFFIFQASTGIILFFIPDTTAAIILQIAAVIQALHWGSALILFTATLALSLTGYLLPWYQRPFWGLIFITTLIGGALAIAHLSFAFWYADWHIPLSPSVLYTLHLLLTPTAIAGLMSIYFTLLRRRGETT